jgi:hypothetical protein
MNSYKIVLVGAGRAADRTGYVHCGSDEQACSAARALLEFHAEHSAVFVYDGDRLVCEFVGDRRRTG